MTPLSNNDLEYMRTSIEGLLPGTCNILSATLASDGAGGMTATWGTVGTAVACRLDAIRGNENIQGASLAPQFSYMMTMPHDTAVVSTNRVEFGAYLFNVVSVNLGQSWNADLRVALEIL